MTPRWDENLATKDDNTRRIRGGGAEFEFE
jgi:hypothetical protein